MNTKGSSETVREIAFQFADYYQLKPQHKPTIDINFLIWFIGFVEGDGSFVISKKKVYFDLTQNLRDLPLLYLIKKTLGFGSILTRTDNHRRVGVFYVTGKPNFERIAHLFNGNLVSVKKKEQFKTWLATLNNQYRTEIPFIDSSIQPSLGDPWLSGFIDAEGCFAARVRVNGTNKSKSYLVVEFSISQKDPQILLTIRDLILYTQKARITPEVVLQNQKTTHAPKYVSYDKRWDGYRLYLANKKVLVTVVNYLTQYPLKTQKFGEFARWCKVYKYTVKKYHLVPDGWARVTKLAHAIRKRG